MDWISAFIGGVGTYLEYETAQDRYEAQLAAEQNNARRMELILVGGMLLGGLFIVMKA